MIIKSKEEREDDSDTFAHKMKNILFPRAFDLYVDDAEAARNKF